MRFLLDTNCCIYLFTHAYPSLNRRVAATAVGEIGLSAITLAEVAHGSERGLAPSPEALKHLVEQMPVLPFDEEASKAYAKLPFERGNFDRLLAAHVQSRRLTLITRNTKHFDSLPGLAIEDWTRP